jgi:thioredoxin 1
MIAPIIEELAKEYAGKVLFGKLNVDENPLVAMRYGIMSIPTLFQKR